MRQPGLPCFFACALLLLAGCTPSRILPQAPATKLAAEIPTQLEIRPLTVDTDAYVRSSVILVLVRTGSTLQVRGSALNISKEGWLITSADVVTNRAGRPFTHLLLAHPSNAGSAAYTCDALATVVRLDAAQNIALLQTVAPLQDDCTVDTNLLTDWNKFHYIDALQQSAPLDAGQQLKLLGFDEAAPYALHFQDATVAGLSGSGTLLLRADALGAQLSPIFLFDAQDNFSGLMHIRSGTDATPAGMPALSAEQIRLWVQSQ